LKNERKEKKNKTKNTSKRNTRTIISNAKNNENAIVNKRSKGGIIKRN
jgi:hypothetical protein